MRNEQARAWSAALIREFVEKARKKGKSCSILNRIAYIGAARMDVLFHYAQQYGFQLVIQPPEEQNNKWYAMGGSWKEMLKAMVFHFWTAEDEEVLAAGRPEDLEKVTRQTERRTKLTRMGISIEAINGWLRRHQVPQMESFCILALCEGFKIEWREVKK